MERLTVDIDHYVEYWSLPHVVYSHRFGPLLLTTTLEDSSEKHFAFITLKHTDIRVELAGLSIPGTVTLEDSNFYYQHGIPSKICRPLIHLLKSLQARYPSKSIEPTVFGNGMETPGENGVQQRIADYLNKYWSLFNVQFLS